MASLSAYDQKQLKEFDRLRGVLIDRTIQVAHRHLTGVYITGRPGTSKTYTIEETLDKIGADYILVNSRISPMGMFKKFSLYPEHTIVLDDVPTLFKNDEAVQILLAALGGTPGKARTITYTTKDEDVSTEFIGGVIAISNRQLRRDPVADALASRVQSYQHEPTEEMIAAFMRSEALRGYQGLKPEQCLEVVEFVIGEYSRAEYRLDLRSLRKGLEDRWFDHLGKSKTDWRDLIRSSVRNLTVGEMHAPRSRDEQSDYKLETAAKVYLENSTKYARVQEWIRLTGGSEKNYYRFLAEARKAGLIDGK